MRRTLRVVAVVIVIMIAAYVLFGGRADEGAGDQAARLQTSAVERGSVVVSVRATGRIEAERLAELSFDGAGQVAAALAEAGQSVEAGQVLVQLDDEVQRIGAEQAEWALAIAELNLAALQEPPAEHEINAAQAGVNSAWAAYVDLRDNSVDEETIRIAELRYQQALTAMQDAELASQEALRSDSAEAARGATGFSAEIARLQLEQLREGPSQTALEAARAQVGQAQARLDQLRAGPSQFQLDQAAISVERARLGLERAQAALEDTVLRAPFAGVVSRVNVEAGGLVGPSGVPAVVLVDLSRLHVTIDVDEVDVAQVAAGQDFVLTLDALPDQEFSGVVGYVAEVARQSEGVVVYEVRLDLDEAAAPIRVGMTAAATVVVQEVADVLVIPNLFVRLDRRTDEAFVNVLDDDGNLVEQLVELGVQNDEISEVRAGLAEADVIAIDLDSSAFSIFGDG